MLVGGAPQQSTAFLESLTALHGAMPPDLCFDGQSTQAMERTALRQRLRLVKNGTPLLSGSVLDHLTQFRCSQLGDQAAALCDQHGVAPAILSLPRGYDTEIGEKQEFPLANGLIFQLQLIQALMEDPAVLLVDGSSVEINPAQLSWLMGLKLKGSKLVAVNSISSQSLPPGCQLLGWQGEQLVEVKA